MLKPPVKGDRILLKRDAGPVIEETCHESRTASAGAMAVEVVTTHDYDIGAQYALFFNSKLELVMCDHIGRFHGDDSRKVVTFSTDLPPEHFAVE